MAPLPWYKEYKILGIPKTFKPYPDTPVYDILETAAKKYKKNGLLQNNYFLSYPQVLDYVNKLASALQSFGLIKNDIVATILPTSTEFIITDYAISKAGLIHLPCSSLEPAEALEHKFKEGKPKVIVCTDKDISIVNSLIKKTPVNHIIVTTIRQNQEPSTIDLKKINIKGSSKVYDFYSLINTSSGIVKTIPINVETDIETLIFTGGTTGIPKGCMLTHRNIYANCIQNLHALGAGGLTFRGAISVILGLPFFHTYGHCLMHTMMLFGFNIIIINDPRDTKSMVENIKKHYPVMQIGVPAQFMKLAKEDLSGIGIIGLSGSAPLSESTQEEFEKRSSSGIMEGYGLSEMSPVTHLNPSVIYRILGGRFGVRLVSLLSSIPGNSYLTNSFFRLLGPKLFGKIFTTIIAYRMKKTSQKPNKKSVEKRRTIGVPFPDTEVRFLDIETGRILSIDEMLAGKRAEMLLNGPQRMLGYWPNPGSGCDSDGFIHTGDIVQIDENGYFYIVDRSKDMINVSGFKVYSKEIDDIVSEHPHVEAAATVGIPNPEKEGSELVVLFVQLYPQYKHKTREQDILKYLQSKVAKYAVPKFITIVDELPRTAVEKVDKKVLREMAVKQFLQSKSKKKTKVKI
ncbi:MAG: AMP-binding protein [Spirochaetes bacterium]|nr:AMP-binding protein [Spirochaetota bacterium]